MCCNSEYRRVREIFENRTLNDWLVGYKYYDICGRQLISPYQGTILVLDKNGVVKAKNPSYNTIFDICSHDEQIYRGIHVYKEKSRAIDSANCFSNKYLVVPVYGQVRDLIGVDEHTAVFTQVTFDNPTIKKILNIRKGKK